MAYIEPERIGTMFLGANFFKWLNFAVQAIRLLFKIFGDEDDRNNVEISEERSRKGNDDAA